MVTTTFVHVFCTHNCEPQSGQLSVSGEKAMTGFSSNNAPAETPETNLST
jgi:hypothetical protein